MVKISIRIGGGVIGRFSRPIAGTTSAEVRLLQNNEHKFAWTDCIFCLKNNIYLIVNIDTYLTGSRWTPSNQELRTFTIDTKTALKSIGANKTNCRFTWDNESLEYTNFDDYYGKLRVIHDALNGEFDLGAGNFRTSQIPAYTTLGSKYSEGYYEVFDVHFQDGMDSEDDINNIVDQFKHIIQSNGIKRNAVTEGNNFYNVSTASGHSLLKYQIKMAEQMGAEDFCFPFVNWTPNLEEGHGNLTYCINDIPFTPHWIDMLSLIKTKKPIIKRSKDGMIIKTIGHKDKDVKSGYGCLLLNETLNFLEYLDDDYVNFNYSNETREALTNWQSAVKPLYNNAIDGRCGRMTWRYFKKEVKKVDVEAYRDLSDDLQIIMSPYNNNGDT